MIPSLMCWWWCSWCSIARLNTGDHSDRWTLGVSWYVPNSQIVHSIGWVDCLCDLFSYPVTWSATHHLRRGFISISGERMLQCKFFSAEDSSHLTVPHITVLTPSLPGLEVFWAAQCTPNAQDLKVSGLLTSVLSVLWLKGNDCCRHTLDS